MDFLDSFERVASVEPEAADGAPDLCQPSGAVLTIFFIARVDPGASSAGRNDHRGPLHDEPLSTLAAGTLIVLMAVRLVLLAVVALNERRRVRTETLRFGLWVCFVVLLYCAMFSGRIFTHVLTDALFKAWLLIFLLVNTIQIFVWIRRAATRVRIPKTLAPPLKK
jgi:hypothetical protein